MYMDISLETMVDKKNDKKILLSSIPLEEKNYKTQF